MAWFCLRKNDKTSTLLPTIYIHTCILILISQMVKKKKNHERVPRQGREELSEQLGDTQLIYDPIITITVYDSLVKVENNHHPCHCYHHWPLIILWEKKDTRSFCYNLAKRLHHRGGWYMNILQVVDKYILQKCPT